MVLRPLQLVALSLAVSGSLARTDIPNMLRTTDVSTPIEPTTMPKHLTDRLIGLPWASLPAALQRAVLWDAGLVRASASSSDGTYQQIYVPCKRTMNDIFLSKDIFGGAETPQCTVYLCNANAVNMMHSKCLLDSLEEMTACGVDEKLVDGYIKADYDPVVMHLPGSGRNNTDVDLFVILEQPNLRLKDDQHCPPEASFVTPCRTIDRGDSDIRTQWCEPEHQLGVELWLKEFKAANGSASSSSTSATEVSTSWASSTVATVLALALGVAVMGCVVLGLLLCKKRSGTGKKSSEYVEMSAMERQNHDRRNSAMASSPLPLLPLPRRSQFNGTGQRPSDAGLTLNDLSTGSAAIQRRHPSHQHSSSHSRGASNPHGSAQMSSNDFEFVNDDYRSQSDVLASFCTDQALMIKRIAYSQIQFHDPIDKGANGEVWRARYDGRLVAVKRVRKNEYARQEVDVKTLEDFTREIRLASMLDHPNVVRFIGLSWRALSDLCMVSELMPGGDLAHCLQTDSGKQMTWRGHKLAIAVDVASALVYLHSLSPPVIHRDLKSRNVLLDDELTAKISDFGLSREQSLDENMTSGVGTVLWTAPEVLSGGKYDEKADVYSFGVLLAELDTCLPPYAMNTELGSARYKPMALMPMITRGEIRPKFSRGCPWQIVELAAQCLDQNPLRRPTAMQVVYELRSKIHPAL